MRVKAAGRHWLSTFARTNGSCMCVREIVSSRQQGAADHNSLAAVIAANHDGRRISYSVAAVVGIMSLFGGFREHSSHSNVVCSDESSTFFFKATVSRNV